MFETLAARCADHWLSVLREYDGELPAWSARYSSPAPAETVHKKRNRTKSRLYDPSGDFENASEPDADSDDNDDNDEEVLRAEESTWNEMLEVGRAAADAY